MTEDKSVVVTFCNAHLLIINLNVAANGLHRCEVKRSVAHPHHFPIHILLLVISGNILAVDI